MHVSLITLHNVLNFGSCLQAYASQKTIEALGHSCEIVDYWRANNTPVGRAEASFNAGRLGSFAPLWKIAPLKSIAMIPYKKRMDRRAKPFESYCKRYLNLTRPYYSESELEQDPPEADVYVTGSDQVWNSIWNEGFEEPYYLAWVPQRRRRVAWSASIGREKLDDWEIEPMREALARYDAISLRESSGVRLVRELGFPEARLVLDPTLMLDRDGWSKIATLPQGAEGSYILSYQLGSGEEFAAHVSGLSKRMGLPVVKLNFTGIESTGGLDVEPVPAVTDFVGLILNAAYVVTDSFHATSFCLNLGTPFTSIAPGRFSTRLSSVLELTGAEERMLGDYADLSLVDSPIDFAKAQGRLAAKRSESLDFLKGAIDE